MQHQDSNIDTFFAFDMMENEWNDIPAKKIPDFDRTLATAVSSVNADGEDETNNPKTKNTTTEKSTSVPYLIAGVVIGIVVANIVRKS